MSETADTAGMIDPNSPELDQFKAYQPREGRKVFAITNYFRGESERGPTIYVGLVVVKDLDEPDPRRDPPTDEGLSARTRFTINEKGTRWIGLLARALKYQERFNPRLDADHFAKVVASNKGILIGTVHLESYTGRNGKERTSAEVKGYEVADLAALGLTVDGELTQEVLDLIARGEEDFADMLAKMAENSAGRSRGGGGGGGAAKRSSAAKSADDDIPF